MGAAQLVKIAAGRANAPALAKQMKDVSVLDVFGNTASVKIVANDWIDYLHVAKWDGRWVIVNVLWEMKPVTRYP
jgi:Putative lumazine-binding